MSEIHFFDVEIASKYGINEAILYTNILYWIKKNKANDKHFHDGRYWTYNSVNAFQKLIPYLTLKQVRNALDNLVKKGVLIKGNYNDNPYDRTNWYAFIEEPEELSKIIPDPLPKKENTFAQKGKSYSKDIYINNITNINTNNKPPYIPPKEVRDEEARDLVWERRLQKFRETGKI